MKNRKNIITEKYSAPLFRGWSADAFAKVLKTEIFPKFLKKDLKDHFDEFFVPKKWFSFEKILKQMSKSTFEIANAGTSECICRAYCTMDLSPEEVSMFLYGDPKDEKIGGIVYNTAFAAALKKVGITAPEGKNDDEASPSEDAAPSDEEGDDVNIDESASISRFFNVYRQIIFEAEDDPKMDDENEENPKMDDEDEENPEMDDEDEENPEMDDEEDNIVKQLQLTIEFEFNKIEYVKDEKGFKKLKQKDKLNPNYITKFSGSIRFIFNNNMDSMVKVGTVTYMPKRMNNMNPPRKPPTLTETLKKLWDNRNNPNDFGVGGMMVMNNIKKMGNAIGDAMTVAQDEEITVSFEPKYAYKNNLKNEDDKKRRAKRAAADSEARSEGGNGGSSRGGNNSIEDLDDVLDYIEENLKEATDVFDIDVSQSGKKVVIKVTYDKEERTIEILTVNLILKA